MRKLGILTLFTVLIVLSCNHNKRSVDCDDYYNVKPNDTCFIAELNIQSKYIIGLTDIYYIWKKYGVIIERDFELNYSDSCYYSKSKEYYTNVLGKDTIDMIIKEVDSLCRIPGVANYYYDGVYSFMLRSRYSTDSDIARPLDKKKYYRTLDSIEVYLDEIKNHENNTFTFWYTINSLGELSNVDVMQLNCPEQIENKIFNALKRIKWKPAVYKGKPVNFRDSQIIHFGTYKDTLK